ncbi:MAG TPA: cation-transporting P-type ATPase [Candidatus Lokiarchaeia archaeon]|nr:cation-transporting P-type ATPase [Candidatus Lokiarchaeia archaeon]
MSDIIELLTNGKKAASYDEIARYNLADLYSYFETESSGLSTEEVKLRMQKVGPNILPAGKKTTIIRKIIQQLENLFNVLLLVAAVLAYLTAAPTMCWAILVAVAINIVFSLYQEHRGEKAAQAIKTLIPSKTKVVRDGEEKDIEVSEVVPGDILVLEEGNRIPADVRLVDAFNVAVNNATLTGESEPQKRQVIISPAKVNDYDLQNLLFAGTTIVSGFGKGIAISTGKETLFGRIVTISREIKEPLSPLEKEINYTAKLTTYASLAIAAFFFALALFWIHLDLFSNIMFAIGVATCMVPEGFQLTISLSLAVCAQGMAKRNVVVKRLSAVETVGSMTALCVDKTGTITSGEMMVKKVWASGNIFDVTGDGFDPFGTITLGREQVDWTDRPELLELIKVSLFCTNCKLKEPERTIGRWTCLGDPTDGAFQVFARKACDHETNFDISEAYTDNPRVHLVPFDYQRRMMTSVNKNYEDGKTYAYTKGAVIDIINKCAQIRYNEDNIPFTDELKKTITDQMDAFASEGFRVLAMATRVLPNICIYEGTGFRRVLLGETATMSQMAEITEIENDMVFLGLAALFDPPRPKIEIAVNEAKGAGIKVFMLTGDHELTAYSIANKVGIITSFKEKVVTGNDLRQMNDEELAKILRKNGGVFARISPEQKLRIVKVLKSSGEIVAVTGDGVNDAPALIEANVGIAMGVGGTDVARESADMVLLDNDFTSIIEAGKLGRATFDNMRNYVYYIYTHNFTQFLPYVLFVLLNIPLPLQVIQILADDLGTDIMPGLSIIMEPPEPNVMKKPTRSKSAKLLDVSILVKAAIVGTVISSLAMILCLHIWMSAGWTWGMTSVPDPIAYARGTTVVMGGVFFEQLGNIWTARAGSESAFKLNPARNKWLLLSIPVALIIFAAQVYSPLQIIYETAPLLPSDILFLVALTPLTFFLYEGIKILARRMPNRKSGVKQETRKKFVQIIEDQAVLSDTIDLAQYEQLVREVSALRKQVDDLTQEMKVLKMEGERKWV